MLLDSKCCFENQMWLIKRYARQSIYHWCMVRIEKSVTRNHCSAYSANLVMPISDPRDRFFYPHRTPMKDSYCLAHGLRQPTRDIKCDVSCLQMLLTRRNSKLRMTFGVGRHFPVIGKKNNLTSVSDTDREIPTLGSTDNDRNTVNLVSTIIRLPSGWDFLISIDDRC